MTIAGYSVGTRCIVATGFRPLRGEIVVKKRIDTVTKVTRKGFEIGKLKFDFNGLQKQKQQGLDSVVSVALPISNKEYAAFNKARNLRKREKLTLIKQAKEYGKLLAKTETRIQKINNTSLSQLKKQTKL